MLVLLTEALHNVGLTAMVLFSKYYWTRIKVLINGKMKLPWIETWAASVFSMELAKEEKWNKLSTSLYFKKNELVGTQV